MASNPVRTIEGSLEQLFYDAIGVALWRNSPTLRGDIQRIVNTAILANEEWVYGVISLFPQLQARL